MKFSVQVKACLGGLVVASQGAASLISLPEGTNFLQCKGSKADCSRAVAEVILKNSKACFRSSKDDVAYGECVASFCGKQCGSQAECEEVCKKHADPLFDRLGAEEQNKQAATRQELLGEAKEAAGEEAAALGDLKAAQQRLRQLSANMAQRAEAVLKRGGPDAKNAAKQLAKVKEISKISAEIDVHLVNVQKFKGMANQYKPAASRQHHKAAVSFLQLRRDKGHEAPEDQLAKEMTHDLEMNFNKIAPFGKEDTAKELQDHAAKTQDTLVDAVENAEVAEIKRAVFRALTRLRAATIKEFDTIARLETQAIDAYNDAHHYRAENPLAHLHEDEAPVETDKLKSFH